MVRSRPRRRRSVALDAKAQALRDGMMRLKAAGEIALANADATNERIIALLAERGAPAETVEKIKAALEGNTPADKRQELADFRRAEIARLNAAGLHDGAIAKLLNIARPHVCQVRNALGIAPAKRRP